MKIYGTVIEYYLCFFLLSMNKKEIYQQFCDKEKEIPIFSQPWYLDAVCEKNGWDILIIKKGDEIAATMPIQQNKKYGFVLPRMPHLTKYWGPYFPKKFRSQKQEQKLTRSLIKQLPKFDFFEQNFHPNFQDSLPFHWEGFATTTRYTFVLESLDNLEEIYSNIDSDYRNNKIPKAKAIVEITSDRTLQEFYEVQKKTFDRQGIDMPFSFEFLKKYDEALANNNARKIFFAVDKENQIHSVVYLIWDEETAYFLMAGDDADLRNSGAGIFLTWHVIEHVKVVLQKNRFDFLGSMIEPITRVRRNFGAKQVSYFNIKKINSKLLKVLYALK